MTPDAFWAAEMQNRRLQQEQQQYDQQALMSGFSMIADAYKQKEQDKSDAKIYGQLMKVIAPAFGQNGDAVLAEYNSFKSDRDKANFGRTMVGSLGVIGNMYAQTNRLGMQQAAPFINAGLQGARDRAAGNQTFTGAPPPDQDPANTAPLPQANAPVTVGPAAGATPQSSRPLGAGAQGMTREDWEKMRADIIRLGNPDPGPYPGP